MTDVVRPYQLQPGEGEHLPSIGVLKASASQTGGSFDVIDYHGPAAPPPHVHRDREEAFFILEGTFAFTLADEAFDAPAGSFVFVPRGTRHGFTASDNGRALFLVSPGGLAGFFRDLGHGLAEGRTSSEIRAALAGKYDSYPAET